eukprot:7187492-Karenia_brevis.AAC.1
MGEDDGEGGDDCILDFAMAQEERTIEEHGSEQSHIERLAARCGQTERLAARCGLPPAEVNGLQP